MTPKNINLSLITLILSICLPLSSASAVSSELLKLSDKFISSNNQSEIKRLKQRIDKFRDDPHEVIKALYNRNEAIIKPGIYKFKKFKTDKFAEKYKNDFLFYYLPKLKDGEKPAGLIISMHGGDEKTTSDQAKGAWSKLTGRKTVLSRALMNSGMIVVMPTAPIEKTNRRWAVAGVDEYLNSIILEFQSQYKFDPNRVYLMGNSMGGDGAYHNVQISPDRYAAVMGISGCCYLSYWPVISGTPFWIVHGKFDANPKTRAMRWTDVSFARQTHRLLNHYQINNEYREYPGGHGGGWKEKAYFINKMKSTVRDPYFSKVTLVTPLANRKSQLVPVKHNRWLSVRKVEKDGELLYDILKSRGVGLPKTPADWKNWKLTAEKEYLPGAIIEAENEGRNTIVIRTNNILKFEVWLHPRMVDFSKPVRIFVNDKLVFNKKVSQSISTALLSFKRKNDWGLIYTARVMLDKKMWEVKPSRDFKAVDEKASQYRTHKIDPYIEKMPASINESFFANPTNEKLKGLVRYLIKGTRNPYQKVKRIHDWITDNLAYNTDGFKGLGERTSRRDLHAFLVKKKTTCGGFARLFKTMALMADVEAVYIAAWVKSYALKKSGRAGDHVWCAVKISGKWHIIDVSSDSRISFHHGKFSSKKPYDDKGLFTKPEIKLLRGIPKKEKYQFIKSPITYDEFMKSPRFLYSLYEFNINFITPIKKLITVKREDREGDKLQSLVDLITIKKESLKIALTCPENVLITAELRDSARKKYTFNAVAYEDGTKVIAEFSPPEPGLYVARIRGKFRNRPGYGKTIYKFYIKSTRKGKTFSTRGSGLYQLPLFYDCKLKIIDSDLDGEKGYYMIDVAFPEDVSVVSFLRDKNKKTISKGLITSSYQGHKRFYYKKQNLNNYFITLFAKRKSEKNKKHNKAALVKLGRKKGGLSSFPPLNCFIFKKRFVENNFKAVKVNVSRPNMDDGYNVKIQSPADYTMHAVVRNKNNKTCKGAVKYSISDEENNIYTFHIKVPGRDRYMARFYMKYYDGKKKVTRMIGYFYFSGR